MVVAFFVISLLTVLFLSATQKEVAQSSPIIAPFDVTANPIKIMAKPDIGMPITIKIPIIGVDATIAYAGLTANGTMDVKPDQDSTAWYELGPRPGEIGNSVIAGHYGWFNGKGSVFNNLHNLVIGDEIHVVDDRDVSTIFIVRESRKYNPDADASSVFNSNDGKAHLNLITCDGTWIDSENTYSDRLVIFTDKK